MLSSLNDDDLDPNKYYLDTGAANHVFNSTAGSIEMVNQLPLVRSWDNSQTAISGVGVFKLKTETDCELTLNNALVKTTHCVYLQTHSAHECLLSFYIHFYKISTIQQVSKSSSSVNF